MTIFSKKLSVLENHTARMSLTGFTKPMIHHRVANKTNESLRHFPVKQNVRLQLTTIRCLALRLSRDSR